MNRYPFTLEHTKSSDKELFEGSDTGNLIPKTTIFTRHPTSQTSQPASATFSKCS